MDFKISNKRGDAISPELIGLFFEDINFAADGGLYAEMIENRSFEAQEAHGTPNYFYSVDDPGYAWSAFSGLAETAGTSASAEEPKAPRLQFITGDPLSGVNPHYLRLTTFAAGQGFSNRAYDGILLKKGMDYKVSFYARCVSYEGEEIHIQIVKDGGVYAAASVKAVHTIPYLPFTDTGSDMPDGFEAFIPNFGEFAKKRKDPSRCRQNDWNLYEAVISSDRDLRGGEFVITLEEAGIVEFDLISMIPADAVAGIFRKDLFDALYAMKPGFIRFPGGCIVEGVSLHNRYQWKKTVGPQKDRKVIPNLWAFQDDRSITDLDVMRPDSHYGQSYGLGFYEFFLLCEFLGAKPLPVLNIGCACQFRSTEIVPVDSPEFQEYVQDALDLIEFANGPADSRWGGLRASMGHPEPFNMDLIGIGNEQWETTSLDLFRRYNIFADAILAKYPDMRLVGTDGPIVDMPMSVEAWEVYRKGQEKNDHFCYAVDEHYYVAPQWMYDRIDFYNDYPRTVGVFAGEYAAHTAEKENDMEAALAEAAFLTGVEKNAGVVKLASYAPLFNRVGHSQWKPDMIWFDDRDVFLTPSYQVQKLYATNLGDFTIPMEGGEVPFRAENVYLSLSGKEDGERILKAVNSGDLEFVLELTEETGVSPAGETGVLPAGETGARSAGETSASLIADRAKILCLQSAGEKPEGMPEPSEITVREVAIDGKVVLPAKSFSVIRF